MDASHRIKLGLQRLKVLSAGFLLASASVAAAQTVTYSNGEINPNNYDTDAGLFLTIDGGSAEQRGILYGAGPVLKIGAGTLTLSGNNSHMGGTVVGEGTLILASNTAAGGGPLAVASFFGNSTLQIQSNVTMNTTIAMFNSTVLNNGTIIDDSCGCSGGAITGTGDSTILNGGTIDASLSYIAVAVENGVVINTGTIKGAFGGVLADQFLSLTNSGTIQASSIAVGFGTGGIINNLAGGIISVDDCGCGSAVFANGGAAILSNAGLIKGTVDLDPSEANAVTLVTGGVIQGNLLIGANSGAQIILDGTGTSSYSSAVTGMTDFTGGSLTKQGSGTWILDQAFNYTGDTTVNAGKLVINGSVLGNVIVNGGILGGNGFVGGSLFNNGGTINVGNSPGVLNVGGNFTQGAGGTLMVEVQGTAPSQFDQLIVGGNVTLGGTLALQVLPGYVPAIGDSFSFITAGGTVTGQFSSFVTNLNGAIQGSLVYNAQGLPSIVLVQGLYGNFAKTPNQRSVATNLDTFSTTGQSQALINYLNLLPGTNLPDAYDQIAPDEYGAMSRPILAYNTTQQSNLQRRFADLREGSTGFSANGFTLMGFDRSLLLAGGGDAMAAQIASDPSKSPMRIAKDNKWGFFVNGSGQFGDVQGDGNGVGYDFTTGGVNVGLDYRLTDSVVVGGSLGYANSSTDTDASGGSLQANNAKALLYASWFKKGFYVNGAVGGGGTSYDTKRNVLGSRVSGSTSGGDFTTFLGGGYDFKFNGLTFGPAGSLDYSYVNVGGFTESGGLAPLQIKDQNIDSMRSRLGILASYPMDIAGVRVSPTLNVAWQHEFLESTQSVSARFANGAGGVFGVQSAEVARDSALAGLGFNVEWSPTISTYVSYDAEAAERYLAQSVSGGVKLKF